MGLVFVFGDGVGVCSGRGGNWYVLEARANSRFTPHLEQFDAVAVFDV